MDSPLFELILLGVLTALNALFTGSEIAFVSLREGQLQRLEETSAGRRVVALARDPNRFLSTCQIGITLASFFASATAAVSFAEPLEESLRGPLGGAAKSVSIALVTLVLAYFTLVFGELAPKRIAMQRSERWATAVAGILDGWQWPLARSFGCSRSRRTWSSVPFGGDPKLQREEVTEEEIRDLLESQEGFSEDQRSIISGAFDIAERTLREIVVPRGSVISVSSDATRRGGRDSGRSVLRAPVHTGDLDDVLGIVHLRDLVKYQGNATDQRDRQRCCPSRSVFWTR